MMNNIRNELGDESEKLISQFFSKKGYWAYILPKKIGGQPFDIIACKENDVWFVDSKHLSAKEASFSFDRIEPNQETSMKRANIAKVPNLGFVINWDRTPGELYFMPYQKWLESAQNGLKSVKIQALQNLKEYFSDENKN